MTAFKDVKTLADERDHFVAMSKIADKKLLMYTNAYGADSKQARICRQEQSYYYDMVAERSIDIMRLNGSL